MGFSGEGVWGDSFTPLFEAIFVETWSVNWDEKFTGKKPKKFRFKNSTHNSCRYTRQPHYNKTGTDQAFE